jgi:hypothetical protein
MPIAAAWMGRKSSLKADLSRRGLGAGKEQIMGLFGAIGEKLGMDKLPGFELVANVSEGMVDGALLAAGPAGWAVLGAKTVAYAAIDPDVGLMDATKETAVSAGLGLVGGSFARGALKGLGPLDEVASKTLKGRAMRFTDNALYWTDDIARRSAWKAEDLMIKAAGRNHYLGMKDASKVVDAREAVFNARQLVAQYGERFVRAKLASYLGKHSVEPGPTAP